MFCPTAVTQPGMLCGHKETIFINFGAPLFNFDFFFFLRRGVKRKGRDERVLEKQGNGGKLTEGFALLMY